MCEIKRVRQIKRETDRKRESYQEKIQLHFLIVNIFEPPSTSEKSELTKL